MKFNNFLFLFNVRRSVYWDNNLAKNWDNIEPTKSGNVFIFWLTNALILPLHPLVAHTNVLQPDERPISLIAAHDPTCC